MTDVVVIGAGMAGVTAARALARTGARVVVLEAGQRIGGRVRTIRDFAAGPVEAGAEFVHGVRAATWDDLRACGARVRPVPYRYSWFNIAGRTRWLPLHLAHPGVWRGFDILRALRRAGRDIGRDLSAERFLARRGLPGPGARAGVAGADRAPARCRGRDRRVRAGRRRRAAP